MKTFRSLSTGIRSTPRLSGYAQALAVCAVVVGCIATTPATAATEIAPPPPAAKTRVVILGVDHSVQLVSSADQPGLLTAFMAKLHPDAICIERPPDLAARGDFYEFTYEVQGIVLPYVAAHPTDICPIDWMPPPDDQKLAFGVDLDVPPEVRPAAGFYAFKDPKSLTEDFFLGEDPTFTDPVRKRANTPAKDSARDFPRRLYLYRTFLQGQRIRAAAKAHPGQTVLVVIGYFHKPDIEAALASDPAIELVQPSAVGRPDPAKAEAVTSPIQRAAILSFNLLGRQAATGNVDWVWMEQLLSDLERTGLGPETALLRARLAELTHRIDVRAASVRYRDLAGHTDPTLRFRWTGVKDPTRLDSYFDPFGNLTVAQRAQLEWARTLADQGRVAEAKAAFARLRAQLQPRPARQLDAYGQAFLPRLDLSR